MTATTVEDLPTAEGRIIDTFGLASWAAVIGVLLTWWLLKSEAPVDVEQELATTHVLSTPLTQLSHNGQSLTERGETAFAAGDIVSPPGDNALYYYQEALKASPGDVEAQQGLSQVTDYLLNEAESSIYHGDFELAEQNANQVLSIAPGNAHARDIRDRAKRLNRVESLLNKAVALYAQGSLTQPAGDNAAELYKQVLSIDPDNDAAKQGLASVVQRVVANAESAMVAGNVKKAQVYVAQARTLDPNAPGVHGLEQTERNIREIKDNQQVKQQLVAAAEALQADQLMPPAQPNAFTLYQQVLAAEPTSEAAKRGLELVRGGLLDRARALLAANDLKQTRARLDDAESAGASASEVRKLRDEADYRQKLVDAQNGKFDQIRAISELTPIRQTAPRYPRSAPRGAAGSVDLHLTVTETGDVRDVEVIGEPKEYFERAAVQAVRGWRFEPMMENGRPIPVRVAVRVTFAT